MKKQSIDWGVVLNRLMQTTSTYQAPGAFMVDENGQLVEDYLEESTSENFDEEEFDTGKTYPLWEGPVEEDEEELLM